MNRSEKRQLFLSAFLAALYLRPEVRQKIARDWMLEGEEIDALEIKSVPSLIFNMVVANEIRKKIGEPKGIKEFFFTGNLYLLDVPSRYSETGVLLPIKDHGRRHIKVIQAFRYPGDKRPFILGKY